MRHVLGVLGRRYFGWGDSHGPAGEQTLQRSSGKVTWVIHLSNGLQVDLKMSQNTVTGALTVVLMLHK